MRLIGAAELAAALEYPVLIDALAVAFAEGCAVPVRHHHAVPDGADGEATLLLMPAWRAGRSIGVKVVTVFPGNGARGLPAVMGSYLLLDGATGEPVALLDGGELTARRTAAASALASRFLSRPDSRTLVMVGTGRLAPHLIAAHAAVRPIDRVLVWGRDAAKAAALAARLDRAGLAVAAAVDLAAAVAEADVVSAATLARDPLIRGDWLRPGQHLDLVGGFTPAMREADDAAVVRSRLYCDTRAGALAEAGDLVDPIRRGVIARSALVAELAELCRGEAHGRRSDEEITLFKSVGTALEDLAAATLALARA